MRRAAVKRLPVVGLPLVADAGEQGPDPTHEALTARVGAACAQALGEALAGDAPLRTLCEVLEEAYDTLDDLVHELEFSPPVACARGCFHCCFNQVSLTPPEALYLGLHILERFTPDQLAETGRRVAHLLPLIKGRTHRELGDIRHLTPCIFLLDGACAVHEARPLACRGWNSVDAETCRLSFESNDPLAAIESHALQRELAGAVQEGLLLASADQNLEAGYLVMTRAVHRMLERGTLRCAADWLEHGPFFAAGAGC